MSKKAWIKVTALSLIAIVGLLVFVNFNISDYKSEVEEYLSEQSGYDFQIEGAFTASLGLHVFASATDVRVSKDGLEFLQVANIEISISLRSLFVGKPKVTNLNALDVRLNLDGYVPSPRTAGSVDIENADIVFRIEGQDLRQSLGTFGIERVPPGAVQVEGRLTGHNGSFQLTGVSGQIGDLSGAFDGTIDRHRIQVTGKLSGPNIDEFMDTWIRLILPTDPFSIEGSVEYSISDGTLRFSDASGVIGENVNVEFDGVLGRFITVPFDFSILDMKLGLAGPSIDEFLTRVPDVVLRDGTQFEARGRVSRNDSTIVVSEIDADISGMKFNGDATYDRGDPPLITADLNLPSLDVERLLAPGQKEVDIPETNKTSGDMRLIPNLGMPFENLNAAVLDIRIATKEIHYASVLAADAEVQLHMSDGVLELNLVSASFHRGSATAQLKIDGRGEKPALTVEVSLQDVMWEAPEDVNGNRVDRPLYDAALELSGTGESLHEVLATADGSFRAEESKGQIEFQLLNEMLNRINPAEAESNSTALECFVALVGIEDGMATSRAIAVQTDSTEIVAMGKLDLTNEELNIRVRVGELDGKRINAPKIFSPLVLVTGSLAKPKITFDPGNVAAALLTDGWSLLLGAFVEISGAEENTCDAAIRRAEKRK